MLKKGKLYIISAPSGTGKSTVIKNLMKLRDNLFFSVSATTRKPRPEETDGREYQFISREQFEDMIRDDEFLEYAEYVGNYYGTPTQPILDHTEKGFDVILDIDVQGHQQVIEKMPEAVSVFLAPPSLQELEARLRKRGTDSEESIRKRLAEAANEMQKSDQYDYVVINDDSIRAASEICDIMTPGGN